ncbi:MAG: A/G-specific adenine glycosylase [Hydrococcus sp. Prado102]|jgi:A/G-specific adenine glycosylase|nr:A/G-specific adenine glycosylase [Hydrococcus sp. Prado102]
MKVAIAQIEENITPAKINWFRRQLSAWAQQNLRDFPWRRTCNPYALFIAEFMLQKTDAQTVAPIYEAFLDRYPTLQELTAATVEEIAQILKPLGLFFRAERLYQSAQIILDKYEGKIPDSEKLLLELPGIGIYTARSICSQAFDQPLAILDTNVARILERFFGLKGDRVKSRCKLLWRTAEVAAPAKKVATWNLTLLDFGAMVCTARNPLCSQCPLQKKCKFVAYRKQTHVYYC